MHAVCEKWPTYRSIKLLKAMQITNVTHEEGDQSTLHMADGSMMHVDTKTFFARYMAVAGDFVICYEGGEEIICSKLDFETGYARV